MFGFVIGAFFVLCVIEGWFLLKSKNWMSFRFHPSRFFLASLLLFTLAFVLSHKASPSSSSRALVFSIDIRMNSRELLAAKELVRTAVKELSCSFGLVQGDGTWLCPLTEDRVFFLLQLDALNPSAEASQEGFPSRRKSLPDNVLDLVFTKQPPQDTSLSKVVFFRPTDKGDAWRVKEGLFSQVLTSEEALGYIQEKEYMEVETSVTGVKPYEKARLAFLLLVGAFCLYRFRKLVPLCAILFICSLEAFETDENVLSASLSDSGESLQAKRFLKQRYLVETSKKKRSSFAFNLSLLNARSQEFKEALFWFKKIEPDYLSHEVIRSFGRDLLSSLLLEGPPSQELKEELRQLVELEGNTPWSQAALAYAPPIPRGRFFYGLSSLAQTMTSPESRFLDQGWKKEILDVIGKQKESVDQGFDAQSLFFLKEEFNQALQEENLEKLSLLLELFSFSSHIKKMEFLIAMGLREARLYTFFSLWDQARQNMSLWMKDQILRLAEKSDYDVRLKGKNVLELFQAALLEGGTTQQSFERLDYLEQVVRQDELNPITQAILLLPLLSSEKERNQTLSLLLQWMKHTPSRDNQTLQETISECVDVLLRSDPLDALSMVSDEKEMRPFLQALATFGGESVLLSFFEKTFSLSLQFSQEKKSPIALLALSEALLENMNEYVFIVKDPSPLGKEADRILREVYSSLKPDLTTNQEKRIALRLHNLVQNTPLSDMSSRDQMQTALLESVNVMSFLEHLLRQREVHSVPPKREASAMNQSSAKIDEEKAVQIVLELEREEREVATP